MALQPDKNIQGLDKFGAITNFTTVETNTL